MAIAASDISLRLSGGAFNTLPVNALGGALGSSSVTTDLFDNVTASRAIAGETSYRCIYVVNNSTTNTMLNTRCYILNNTPSPYTVVAIGKGTAAVSTTEQSVANTVTPPVGVSFTDAPDAQNAVMLGDIPVGGYVSLWLRRAVTAGAVLANDSFSIKVFCDSTP